MRYSTFLWFVVDILHSATLYGTIFPTAVSVRCFPPVQNNRALMQIHSAEVFRCSMATVHDAIKSINVILFGLIATVCFPLPAWWCGVRLRGFDAIVRVGASDAQSKRHTHSKHEGSRVHGPVQHKQGDRASKH